MKNILMLFSVLSVLLVSSSVFALEKKIICPTSATVAMTVPKGSYLISDQSGTEPNIFTFDKLKAEVYEGHPATKVTCMYKGTKHTLRAGLACEINSAIVWGNSVECKP